MPHRLVLRSCDDVVMGELQPPQAPLGSKFTRVWSASTLSNLGDGVFLVAVPLLAASLTRDPFLISLVAMAGQLPWLVFSFFSGTLVDRWDRKTVMWTTDVYRMVVVGLLAVGIMMDWVTIPVLAVAGFSLSLGEVLFDNASQTILPAVVSTENLERANGRLISARVVTNNFLGNPLGGLLFRVGRSVPFVMDAVSFGVSAVLIKTMSGSFGADDKPDATFFQEVKEGIRWLWNHTLLRTMSIEVGILNFWFMAQGAIFVLHVQDNFGLDDVGFGLLLGIGGVGAFLASLVASRIADAAPVGPLLFTIIAASGIAMFVTGATSSPYIAGGAIAISAAATTVWNIVTVSLRQAITPNRLLGRINSAYQIPAMGAVPLGALAGGVVATVWGVRSPMLVGGVVILLTAVAVLPIVNTQRITTARQTAD